MNLRGHDHKLNIVKPQEIGAILQTTFQIAFLAQKLLYLDSNIFTDVCSRESN